MILIDIASIVFVSVTMNHLGLIEAIEEKIDKEIPIVECPKCCSFWCSLVYMLIVTHEPIKSLAVSFLSSYSALWLELIEVFVDSLYLRLYGKITTEHSDYTAASCADGGHSEGSVS